VGSFACGTENKKKDEVTDISNSAFQSRTQLGFRHATAVVSIMCVGVVLAIAPAVHAAGTYHHPEPYVVHPDRHKTHSWAPVIVYSPKHGHYHLTYHPEQ
jgi:hypothetical protein